MLFTDLLFSLTTQGSSCGHRLLLWCLYSPVLPTGQATCQRGRGRKHVTSDVGWSKALRYLVTLDRSGTTLGTHSLIYRTGRACIHRP